MADIFLLIEAVYSQMETRAPCFLAYPIYCYDKDLLPDHNGAILGLPVSDGYCDKWFPLSQTKGKGGIRRHTQSHKMPLARDKMAPPSAQLVFQILHAYDLQQWLPYRAAIDSPIFPPPDQLSELLRPQCAQREDHQASKQGDVWSILETPESRGEPKHWGRTCWPLGFNSYFPWEFERLAGFFPWWLLTQIQDVICLN